MGTRAGMRYVTCCTQAPSAFVCRCGHSNSSQQSDMVPCMFIPEMALRASVFCIFHIGVHEMMIYR